MRRRDTINIDMRSEINSPAAVKLHRRQFVVGPHPFCVSDDWLCRQLSPSTWVSYCPELRAGWATDADGTSWSLLGLAVQTREDTADPLDGITGVPSEACRTSTQLGRPLGADRSRPGTHGRERPARLLLRQGARRPHLGFKQPGPAVPHPLTRCAARHGSSHVALAFRHGGRGSNDARHSGSRQRLWGA